MRAGQRAIASALRLAAPLAASLAVVHRRTTRRDVGVCEQLEAHTSTRTIVGAPSDRSREQRRGARAVGPRSDVCAPGCAVLFVIASRAPFRLVSRMLAKARGLRPAMAEAQRALTSDLRGAGEVSTRVHPAPSTGRQRALIAGAAVVALSAHAPRGGSSSADAALASSVIAAPAGAVPGATSRLVLPAPSGDGEVRAPSAAVKPPIRPPGSRPLTPVRPLLLDAGPDGATPDAPDAPPGPFDAGVDSLLIDPWSTR